MTERGLKNINVFYSTFTKLLIFVTFFNVFIFFWNVFFYIYEVNSKRILLSYAINTFIHSFGCRLQPQNADFQVQFPSQCVILGLYQFRFSGGGIDTSNVDWRTVPSVLRIFLRDECGDREKFLSPCNRLFSNETSLCGRDGRTICGPLRQPKSTYVTLAHKRKQKFFSILDVRS